MADGSIRVNTSLNLTGLKRDIKEFEREIARAESEIQKLEQRKSKETAKEEPIIEAGGPDAEAAIERQIAAVEKINKQQEELSAKAERYKELLAAATAEYEKQQALSEAGGMLNQAIADDKFAESITSQSQYNSLLDETAAKMARIEQQAQQIALAQGVNADELLKTNATYQKLSDRYRILTERTYEFGSTAQEAGRKASKGFKEAEKSSDALGNGIKKITSSMKKIAFATLGARSAFMVLKQAISSYISQNEELQAQINGFKGLISQAIGPAIEYVVNLFAKAISYVNAFINSLTGINLVAKANTAALKAQGAAARQLAGFDEQTKLSDNSANTNTASGLNDGLTLDLSFLDPLKKSIEQFQTDISPLMNTLKDYGSAIKENIIDPFANWTVNELVPSFFNLLGSAAGVLDEALKTAQPILKWLWEDWLEPMFKWTGKAVVDFLNDLADWIRDNKEPLGKIVGIIGGIVAVLMTLSNPVFLVLKLISTIKELWETCDEFRTNIEDAWEGLKEMLSGIGDIIAGIFGDESLFDEGIEKFKEGGSDMLEGLWEGLKAGWEWVKEKAKKIWDDLLKAFEEFFGIASPSKVFKEDGNFMIQGLIEGFKGGIKKIGDAAKTILDTIKNVFKGVPDWFRTTFHNAWQKVKDVFSSGSKVFDGIKAGIENTFRNIVNGLIGGINNVIAFPFNQINNMLNMIRDIQLFGVFPFANFWGYNPLSVPQIPRLARGGIVNNPGRGVLSVVGESGAEAILPLENNTEWMDALAEKINGGTIIIPVYLGTRQIEKIIIDGQKKRQFAANGGI